MLCLTAQEAWRYQLAEGYVKQAMGWVNISWADAQLDWFSDTNKFQMHPTNAGEAATAFSRCSRFKASFGGAGSCRCSGAALAQHSGPGGFTDPCLLALRVFEA